MGSFGDYLEDELLDHVFGMGNRDWTPPSAIYVALSTADPGEDGSGLAEPSAGVAYGRQTTSAGFWTIAASGALQNSLAITFTEATGDWDTLTHFDLRDTITIAGGNQIGYGTLTVAKLIQNGDTARFAAGDLDVTLD